MRKHGLIIRDRTALVGAVEQQMLQPARRAGYRLPIIGTGEVPHGEFLWKAPTERWWVFNDHRDDPTAAQYGGVVVPPEVRAKLTRLLAEGFAPDVILVGHEMPNQWSPGQPLPDLVPTTSERLPARPERASKLRAIAASPTTREVGRGALKAGRLALKGGIALGVVTGAVVATVAAAAVELDPVIVAGVRLPDSDVATFVEVARWSW